MGTLMISLRVYVVSKQNETWASFKWLRGHVMATWSDQPLRDELLEIFAVGMEWTCYKMSL